MVNPHSWAMYQDSLVSTELPNIINASLSKVLYYFTSISFYYTSFTAYVFFTVIFTYWLIHENINMKMQLPGILFFSIIFSPYTWSHDYILAYPLLLQSYLFLRHDKLYFSLNIIYTIIFSLFAMNYHWIAGYQFIIPQLLLLPIAIKLVFLGRSDLDYEFNK